MLTALKKGFKKFLQIEDIDSITKDELYKYFDYERASKYLTPIAYDENGRFFILEDNAIGFGFLLSVKPSIGKETLTYLENGIYQDHQIPENSIIQWIMWGGDFVDPLLDAYLNLKNKGDKEAYSIAKRYVEFVKEKSKGEIYEDWRISIRNIIAVMTVKIPFDFSAIVDEKEYQSKIAVVKHIQSSIYGTLMQANFAPIHLTARDYLVVSRLLANPSHDHTHLLYGHDENVALKEQVIYRDTEIEQHVDGNYLKVDGVYGKILSVKSYPKEVVVHEVNEWWGAVNHVNRNQINCKFVVSFCLRKAAEKEITAIKAKIETLSKQKSFSALSAKLAQRQTDAILVSRKLEDGQVLWKGLMQVFLYDSDKERVGDSVRVFHNLTKLKNVDFQEELVTFPFYLACLPFNTYKELTMPSVGRAATMFSYNAAHLTPLQFDWTGSGTPVVPLVSRRGQLAFVDMWDTNGGMNACIVAPMGQGKSMFANHIVFNYRTLPKTKIRIIDVGESYFGIASLFKGNFVKPTFDKPVRINPFSHIRDIDSDTDFLVNIVDTMIKPTERCSDTERGMITVAIRKAYKKYGNDMDINAIRSEIDAIAEENKDYEFKKLADFNLSPWCRGGQYEKFMVGKSEIDLENRLVVFELGQIKDDVRLTSVFLLSVFFFLNNEIYKGDRDIRKIVLWDEAWRFADNEAVLGFIEGGAREYRKFNGSLIFITQGISDLLKNSVTKTLKNNSEYLFLFRQPPEEWERIFSEKELVMTDYEKNIYRDTIATVKGKYSEMLVISRSVGRGILRLVLPPELYWVYTTNAQEVALRNKIYEQTGDILETVKRCIECVQEAGGDASRAMELCLK